MRWIILTYLILNPFFYWINFDQRDTQQICFQLSSVVVFSLGMFFQQRQLRFSKLNASIGVMMLAFIFAWFRTMSGWPIALNLLCGILVYMTIIKTLNKDDIWFIFKGLAYFTAFCVIILAGQLIQFDFRGAAVGRGEFCVLPESIFFQRSAMGMFFAQMIPIILTLTPVSLLLLIPMLWGESIAAFLGVFIGIPFFLWFRKRVMFWIFLAITILGMIITPFLPTFNKMYKENLTGFGTRLTMWPIVIQTIFHKPIGRGLDSFANPPNGSPKFFHHFYNNHHTTIRAVKGDDGIVKGYTEDEDKLFKSVLLENKGYLEFNDHPHNEYLWLGYEIGIHAWIILGFIFYFLWERFKLSKRDVLSVASMSVLIIFAIEATLQFNFHLSRIASLFPFILGVFYIATEE